MEAADYRGGGRRRFAVACGVLSRCVKAEAAAAAAAAGAASGHPTMLLMPGADVVPDVREEAAAAAAQLKIMYGGRVLVFDDFPAGSAVELVRAAARAGREQADDTRARRGGRGGLAANLPVVRKGSLQRFVEKRRRRLGVTAPYSPRRAPARAPFAANAAGKEDGDAGRWLVLGTPGSGRAAR